MNSGSDPIDKKPDRCSGDDIAESIVKAISYADRDPETALMHARKSAEAICYKVFSAEIGDPGNNRLDKLIELLSQKGNLPEHIKIPMWVIQQYGNYGAHFQAPQVPIDRAYIDPCLSALILVTNWYFHDYLGTDVPLSVVKSNNEFEPYVSPPPERTIASSDQAMMARELALPHPLRPYQWDGVNFLVRNASALLADEMGLGKTVQVIVALDLLFRNLPSQRALVVAPNALMYNWEREFAKWARNLVVRKVVGSSRDRRSYYQLPIQVLIASYEQLRADALDMDPNVHFDVVILDEAQRVKNRNSRVALACRLLRRGRTWALTGTPLENNVEDLASIFLLLSPGLVDNGMPPAEIHRRIRPYFLRRRKKEVLAEIPPIIEKDTVLELTGAQENAYSDMWLARRVRAGSIDTPLSDMDLFSLITKLKQLCNYDPKSGESVKLEALQLVLEECMEPDDKVIVFSQYVETLRFISGRLGGFPYDMYTGDMSQTERDEALTAFKMKPGPRALLISLRAGGVGLNIQEASTAVLFDRWWNPAVENQAIQRAHRLGRERPLYAVRFLVANTIEERIAAVLRNKEADFERYIERAESAPLAYFTRSELLRILELTVADADGLHTS